MPKRRSRRAGVAKTPSAVTCRVCGRKAVTMYGRLFCPVETFTARIIHESPMRRLIPHV